MIKKVTIVMLVILFAAISCSEFDRFDGPRGRRGAPGRDGADAPSWITSAGMPGNEIGLAGDFYLDTTSGFIFRKDGGEWAYLASISGGDGTDGSLWLSGLGAPDTNELDGTLYLDNETGNIYLRNLGVWEWQMNVNGNGRYQVLITATTNSPNPAPLAGVSLEIDSALAAVTNDEGEALLSFDLASSKTVVAGKKFFVSNSSGITPSSDLSVVQISLAPQIFFPDKTNPGIIRIDDLSGTNRTEITQVNGSSFWDPIWVTVDYENGRIFVLDRSDPDIIFLFDEFTESEQPAVVVTPDISGNLFDVSQLTLDGNNGFYVADSGNSRLVYFPNTNDLSYGVADNLVLSDFTGGVGVLASGDLVFSLYDDFSQSSNLQITSGIISGIAGDFADVTNPITFNTGPNDLKDPSTIIADDTYIYVSDSGDPSGSYFPYNHRIARYLQDGKGRENYGGSGSGDNQFDYPVLLAILPDDRLYILDTGNNRIASIPKSEFTAPIDFQEYNPGDLSLDFWMSGCG
jgi:hypothetical protein